MKEKKYLAPVIMSLLLIGALIYSTKVRADNMQELQSKKSENESNMESAQEQASQLESSKSDLEALVVQFNSEMESLGNDLNEIESQMKAKKKEIKKCKKRIKSAEKKKDEQYKAMKERIQFLFEAGDSNYLEIFLNSESLSDSLNRAEYFSQLYQYDREMLTKYQDTLEDIQSKNTELQNEKSELSVLQKQNEDKQAEVSRKIASSSQQIQQYSAQISEAESKAMEYENNAAVAEAQIQELEEESRRAEEERLRILWQQSQGPAFDYSASDLELLATLIQAEAENQPYEGKLAVGSVVINRINSSYYPNTMMGVLYQPYQFTPVTVNNRFAMILARGANAECYQAAQEVLDGKIVGSWLYFRTNDGSRTGTVIGDHVFY